MCVIHTVHVSEVLCNHNGGSLQYQVSICHGHNCSSSCKAQFYDGELLTGEGRDGMEWISGGASKQRVK